MRKKIFKIAALVLCVVLLFAGCAATEEVELVEFTLEDGTLCFEEFDEMAKFTTQVQDGTFNSSDYSAGATMTYVAANVGLADIDYIMYMQNEVEGLSFNGGYIANDYISVSYYYEADFTDTSYTASQQYMMSTISLTTYYTVDSQAMFDEYASYEGSTLAEDGSYFTYPITDGTAYLGSLVGSINDDGNLFVMYIPSMISSDVFSEAALTGYTFS